MLLLLLFTYVTIVGIWACHDMLIGCVLCTVSCLNYADRIAYLLITTKILSHLAIVAFFWHVDHVSQYRLQRQFTFIVLLYDVYLSLFVSQRVSE